MVKEILTREQLERFEAHGDLDVAHTMPGYARFRVNLLKTRASTGMAIRRIPEQVPTIHSLHLSPTCRKLAERRRGLVLVTGPTGSGKSTTLAALLDHVNRTRPCHILTMEDPIEFTHREIKAHVAQREVGRDTEEFATALKRALRQDPDVIMVGEMRDLETIGLAVTAAETATLCSPPCTPAPPPSRSTGSSMSSRRSSSARSACSWRTPFKGSLRRCSCRGWAEASPSRRRSSSPRMPCAR
jgi:twitching motility protein PilT